MDWISASSIHPLNYFNNVSYCLLMIMREQIHSMIESKTSFVMPNLFNLISSILIFMPLHIKHFWIMPIYADIQILPTTHSINRYYIWRNYLVFVAINQYLFFANELIMVLKEVVLYWNVSFKIILLCQLGVHCQIYQRNALNVFM